jgi:hypothetical protein
VALLELQPIYTALPASLTTAIRRAAINGLLPATTLSSMTLSYILEEFDIESQGWFEVNEFAFIRQIEEIN